MNDWTQAQWIAFGGWSVAGTSAVVLLVMALQTVRGWTAPAPLRLAHAAGHTGPRPSITRAVERRPLPAVSWTDPMRSDFTDGGIGALSSILAAEADPALVTEHERTAEDDAWVHAYADMSAMMPETAAAAETMRINLEPALRKAHLWLIRAGETGARAALAEWRMSENTGEIRNPFAITPRSVAHTLLVS